MASSGMLRRVALVRTDISEELSASKTSVLTRAIRRNISESAILYNHRRESLKSYNEEHLTPHVWSELPGRPRGRSSSPGRVQILHFSTSRRSLRITQPPTHYEPEALSLEVKRPMCGTAHSPPTSAEVKKTWTYTSTPPYAFMP
jgi:hypothetical protein